MTNSKEFVLKKAAADAFYAFPCWSPDGARIAYALDVTYTGSPSQNWGSDLAVAATDGSGEQIVLRRPTPGFKIEGLAWSPDGTALFAGILDTTIRDGRFIGQTLRLERIELADGARTPVVADAVYPTAASDGSRIAFITFSTSTDSGGLWTARPDGSDRRLIVPATDKFALVTQPRFSPDGATIAFSAVTFASGDEQPSPPPQRSARRWPWQPRVAAAHGAPQDVWLVAAAGGEPRRLTNMLEDEPCAAWSPDGAELAIVATGGLYTVSAAGGEPRKIGLGGTTVQIDWR